MPDPSTPGGQKKDAFTTTVYHIDRALREYEGQPTQDDKIKELVPTEYYNFLPLFKKAVADILPPHRPYDYKIALKEGFNPPFEFSVQNRAPGPPGMAGRESQQRLHPCVLFTRRGTNPVCQEARRFIKAVCGLPRPTIKNRYPYSTLCIQL